MTYLINLANLVFPLYYIGTREPIVDGLVSYFVTGRNTNTEDAEYNILILDDKAVEGDTLAKRRLILKSRNVPLKKITRTIFFLSDFIKLAKAANYFIDSVGTIFKYKKTKTVRLTYKKILKLIPMSQGGALIEIEGVPGRHKILFMPSEYKEYAGVLVDGITYIFYGLYDKKYKDSYRMI